MQRQSYKRAALIAGACVVLTFALGAWAFGLRPGERDTIPNYAGQVLDPCKPSPKLVRSPSSPQPAAGQWRTEASSPVGRDEATGATLDGKIYLMGGHDMLRGVKDPWFKWSTDRVVTFDPRSGRYADGTPLPRPVDHAAAVEYEGDLYVVGGWINGKSTNQLLRYSPDTREWTKLAPMKQPRGALQARVIGSKLYAVGGAPPTLPDPDVDPYSDLEIYDFETGRWSAGADIPTPRHHMGSAALDGKLYVVGGRQSTNYHITAVEAYDPASDSWRKLPDLPQGVSAPAMTSDGDEIVVMGGADERSRWVTPAVWAFNPQTDRWRRLPDLNVARHAAVAEYVDGRIYVFEGSPCPGYGGTGSAESLAVG